MPTRTQAIKSFLLSNTHNDLALLYNENMEVQVNVARDSGEKASGEYKGREYVVWTDGVETWKSFRIPYNAASDPEYKDIEMSFSLDRHAEGIGMTGWDWKNRQSLWVAFDFDSLTGHADAHKKKLSQQELDRIKEIVAAVPWVTLRRSTGGSGLHLYVFLENCHTNNHTEHAGLARSILHMLSGLTGYEFNSKVDVCGANMWVWHRKLSGSNGEGLQLLKQGTRLSNIPANWKDHVPVVNGRSARVHLQQISEGGDSLEEMFDKLTGQRTKLPLDSEHKRLINWLSDNKCFWWWDNNMWMLVTHTSDLKAAHEELKFRGMFKTIATGSERGTDHNCFAYPLLNGGWVVRRYTPGTQEADTWQQDGKNWTRCFYNREVDLPTACAIANGTEHPNGGFYFGNVGKLCEALKSLGIDPELPDFIKGDRHCLLKPGKTETKIVVSIGVDSNDSKHPQKGWILEKGKNWVRVFTIVTNASPDEIEKNENYDDIVRHIVSEAGEDRGWVLKGQDGIWRDEPLVHIKHALGSQGYVPKDINDVVGVQVIQAWKIVNRPFEPEYPGNREWNRGAAQLAYLPSRYSDSLAFPTWNLILEHCGAGLDDALKENDWAKKNNVLTGADYLKLWTASLFKYPTKPLPYLFFWSEEQNTGKSSFHIALSYLLTKGYMKADSSLTADFNGELDNAILCVIEEQDLSRKGNSVYNRIKDWVTSPQIMIHAKHITPYLRTNTTHWVQCANDYKSCPVFPGDTRITMVRVPPIPADKLIVPTELEQRLRIEAPDFLAYIMRMEVPPSGDRLFVPMISTDEKAQAQDQHKSPLQMFIEEVCHPCMGNVILFAEFYAKFQEWLDAEDRGSWSKIRVGKELPIEYPRGRLTSNPSIHVANLAFEQTPAKGNRYYADGNGFLRLKVTT